MNSYRCPECGTPLIRVGEYTFFCIDCEKKVGALVREFNDDGDVEWMMNFKKYSV